MSGDSKILRITLIKSVSGRLKTQKLTVQSLGLRKIGQTVEQLDTPSVRGMLNVVGHLVKVV